jgi:hypothetical protein
MSETMKNLFAIVVKNEIVEYPVNPMFKLPNVSFDTNWEGGIIQDLNFVKINRVDKPSCNLGWDAFEQLPTYISTTRSWSQNWKIEYIGKYALKSWISNIRYLKETNGVLIDNVAYSTDRNSQNKYSTLALNNTKTYWKINATDFVYTDMKIIDEKVRNYVHECFEIERKFFEIIDSEDMDLIENTDFESGWPDNNIG